MAVPRRETGAGRKDGARTGSRSRLAAALASTAALATIHARHRCPGVVSPEYVVPWKWWSTETQITKNHSSVSVAATACLKTRAFELSCSACTNLKMHRLFTVASGGFAVGGSRLPQKTTIYRSIV